MKEGLTARVGRIISGSFNALIDAVENVAPETVMEQAIREIDDAISAVRAELGQIIANKHLAGRRQAETNRRHEELSGRIELAIRENREDLAEAAVAQQLDLEAQIPVLEQSLADSSAREKELESYIAALQAKKREMRDDLREYRLSRKQTQSVAAAGAETGGGRSVIDDKAERAQSAFNRVLERQTGLEGGEKDLKSAGRLAELEDLARTNRIKERLAAAKARVKGD